MTKIIKKIAAMSAAVMMMGTMVISASAFSANNGYGRATGGSGTNAYVSCYVTGAHTNNVVSGTAWTKTSSNRSNVYNPNCAYSGYTNASVTVGGVGCGSASSQSGSATKNFSLSGCTTSKVVKTSHIYNSSTHGNYSTTLSANS